MPARLKQAPVAVPTEAINVVAKGSLGSFAEPHPALLLALPCRMKARRRSESMSARSSPMHSEARTPVSSRNRTSAWFLTR